MDTKASEYLRQQKTNSKYGSIGETVKRKMTSGTPVGGETILQGKWWSKYVYLDMIPAKLTYFLCEAYMGCILPFLNIFFVSLGLTAAQAGLITGVSFAVAAIAGPVWSSVIETTGHRKLIFVILCFGAATTVFGTPWISNAVGAYEFNATCPLPPGFPGGKHPPHPPHPPPHPPHKPRLCRHLTNPSELFYTMLSISVISRIFFITLPSYIDSIVVKVVKTRTQEVTYGEQKVFGVVGFGVTNFIAGLAIDHYHPHNGLTPFTAIFYVFLPCILLLIPAGYKLISQIPEDTIHERRIATANFGSHMTSFLKKPETAVFLTTVTVSGTALNMLFNFLVLFMIQDLHSPKIVITTTFLVCMLTQLIGFPLSAKVIKLSGGPIPVFIIGILSYLPRFLLMSYIQNPWFALPINLVEPIGLAFSWAAMVEHTYAIAPKEISLTSINIIATLHFVASSALANIFGGMVFHKYGGRVLFRGMGILCGVWSALITCYYGFRHYKNRRKIVKNVHCNDVDL